MLKYLIVCPLVFLAGYIDAIAGGGGLITLPAYLLAGLPAHSAVATNKISSSMGTSIATFQYARMGYIPWRLAIPCALCAILGSNGGARLSLLMDDTVLKSIMLVLLPLTAILVFRGKVLEEEREPLPAGKTLAVACTVAVILGAYDGFYGPGTGTFLLLLLTSIAHLKLTTANGITKAINFSSNITAVVVYVRSGNALIPLGLAAGVFSIAGNWLGAGAFGKKGVKIAKPVMLTVLGIFFIKVIYDLLAG